VRIYYIISPIIIISLTIISSGLINITYGQVNETSQTYTYENTSEGIRFQYPSYWGNLSEEGGCISKVCSIPLEKTQEMTYRFNFAILKGSSETSHFATLSDFAKLVYPMFQNSLTNFSFINDNQTSVGKKYPALQIEFSGSAPEFPDQPSTTKLIILTKVNNTFYEIGFYPFTEKSRVKQLPELRYLIDSMEFFPPQIPVTKTPSFMNMNETEERKVDTTTENNRNGLQILSHNSFTDSTGFFHIVGEVKNDLASAAELVRVIATFYDTNNQVVATSSTYSDPSGIGSGDTAPFEIILTSASVPISQIDHYNLQASSQ
jgi:hypothetical protein